MSTNSLTIIAAMSPCATSRGAIAASPITSWLPAFQVPEDPAIRRTERDAFAPCLTRSQSRRPILSEFRWAALRPCISGSPIRRALSLIVAVAAMAPNRKNASNSDETAKTAALIASAGMKVASETYAIGPSRVQFQNKDPRGWAEFAANLAEHSTLGSANTMRGVQARRPSLWDLTDQMRNLEVPTLIMTGDEDDPCLEPGLLMKRTIPTAALVVFPNTGHAVNLEEPDLFNRSCDEFFHQVESGRWPRRDPRSLTGSILGVR